MNHFTLFVSLENNHRISVRQFHKTQELRLCCMAESSRVSHGITLGYNRLSRNIRVYASSLVLIFAQSSTDVHLQGVKDGPLNYRSSVFTTVAEK